MSNMVYIRASRCIYTIPLQEWFTVWKPRFPVCEEWFTRIGEKYVTLECGRYSYRLDEEFFNKEVSPLIPYNAKKQALKRGKGTLRFEKSYDKKGVKKHATDDWS